MEPGSAQLRLRDGPLRIAWPAVEAAGRRGAIVLLFDASEDGAAGDAERLSRTLSEALEMVSLSAGCRGLADAAAALEWTADHAGELGADGRRLVLAGFRRGATLAAELAVRARDDGWPSIAELVLVEARSGLAPARVGLPVRLIPSADLVTARGPASGQARPPRSRPGG